MIKFFRHIRQNLLMQNKTSKYFKYAIGEIVLVVVGILIALQINNWNEKNIADNATKIYLNSLILELDSNNQLFRGALKSTQDDMRTSNYYLTLFNQKNIGKIQDSSITNMIDKLGNILFYAPSQSTIEDLINSGTLKAMKNEKLKKKILEIKFVYEAYKQLGDVYVKWRDTYLIPYFIEHANLTKVSGSLSFLKIPKIAINSSKEMFINNKKFNNILFTMQIVNTRNEKQFISWIRYLDELSREIEKYLKHD